MGFSISKEALDKYFSFLTKFDVGTKKSLILKLTKSIESDNNTLIDLKTLFGAWEDSRDSDTIINEIKNSRVNSREIENF